MELKNYQKNVISDLDRFLSLLTEKQSTSAAYRTLWEEKGVLVGENGLPPYNSQISGAPDVCFKVPTGGGKTFLAASAIKPIFDSMPDMRAKAVVWLVPSDAILTQTYAALSDAEHPYRQRLDVDFGGRVEVYSKTQLQNAQNFNPTVVTEQLSVFVLSYDSFRTSKKEGRKAYQENGNLADFSKRLADRSVLLTEVDETALIQAVRSMNPVVIVDESHHATSDLSLEMLNNFNPCFVLDLTATPKSGSNIISFVDAAQLKKENMVKLPVIVYNRKSQSDVYCDAVSVRQKLENQAKREQETSGRYIRPIALFQAQPRIGEDSATYEKIKKTLVEAGIPAEQIAIKTGDNDELKKVDLVSPDCPIRYIITVNALKEGWDCPFAYVLATVANRTSAVDVEQILGRVLRLPYAKKNADEVLNLSYVITSSKDFHETLERVVAGLNSAGFSSKDYRVGEDEEEHAPETPHVEQGTLGLSEWEDEDLVDTSALKYRVAEARLSSESDSVDAPASDHMFSEAVSQSDKYKAEIDAAEITAVNLAPQEVRDKMKMFRINEEFSEEAAALRFPQFMLKTGANIFTHDEPAELTLDDLSSGFTLKDKSTQIDFAAMETEMARVDIDDAKDAVPKAWKITGVDSAYFKAWFNSQPSDYRLAHCKNMITQRISSNNNVPDSSLRGYIDRVINNMSEDQISDLEQSTFPYCEKINGKVIDLLEEHREKTFNLWLDQGKIICCPHYSLPSTISPVDFTTTIPRSLYEAEENMNEYERKVTWQLSSMGTVKWWHRNISRRGFQINGFIHAYPDIIVMTESGKILMVETKGDHLDNDDSKNKALIGSKWDSLSGDKFRYFMVFETRQPDYAGSYSYDRFIKIMDGI